MKHTFIKLLGAAVIAVSFTTTGGIVRADDEKTVTTVTTSSGTITDFGPERIVVRSETAPQPLTYTYSKTTTYVDEDGNPVSVETVKSGAPVTVQYTKVGDHLVASKVIVRKTVTRIEK